MQRKVFHPALRAAVLALSAWTMSAAVGADTFTVTRTDDPIPDVCLPSDCSLREAVIEANGNGLADTVILPAGTYVLAIPGQDEDAGSSGDVDISEDLAISGAGSRATIIDGGAQDRVFEVLSGAVVSISELTIRNGLTDGAGGGVRNTSGELTLTRCTLIDNISSGSLGGGFHGLGTVLIVESTVQGNTAWRGGGVAQGLGGAMIVLNSTISGNMATDWAGGVYSAGAATTVELISTTVSGNVADADDDGFGGAGGIMVDNTAIVTVSHTIVAGNLDVGGEVPDCRSTSTNQLISSGYNLIGNTSQCPIFGDETGNLYDVDPQLPPLVANGGPTDTHALLAGSPAVDAGNPAGCLDENDLPLAADQRGEPRPTDGDGDMVAVCDMGAFEFGDLVFTDGFESGDTSVWSGGSP